MFNEPREDLPPLKVGMVVWFKADVEQRGRIVEIEYRSFRTSLKVVPADGGRFSGGYIGGDASTWIDDDDVFGVVEQ